ncbi:HAD family hydrolase [Alkalihalobacillus alcalophilus ATCC 27647 = CGMCC 1.3604]|uniref:HAD family hydrolase n=1 Tax=Alkalihalobacillus alcalophilus ATCC 27647 = CGMCC 1.3604 TaxID=1218173 RepID=A0A094WQ27_ALKAL|nr:Cof-type HAD-IIB family hydrolase [Alkalihalobacillus alcalophilus]KGA98926.1 HAD family hydrolase [Alkalihalobacillus alcalophilus ATCC 27647 = CGMCC 1.3604]MED1561958.1 Cof-type HAD-IIB family hydrolase [Alkalihalobacillus alcalophilus]THG88452.1 HAD family hydrolase [Alkalihalobacillus alcalophilus ATCC 27647 = CGMCC 1.3604]
MNYKIIFFDVDGTLTDHTNGHIPLSTKKAIATLVEKGMKVVAATGRPLSMCHELRELGIETFITANGGYVKHQLEVIYKSPLQAKTLLEVCKFAALHNQGLSFFTEEFTMNGVQNEEIAAALAETLSVTQYPSVKEEIYRQEVFLMCLYANEEMVKKFKKQFPHLTFSRWHPFITNVLQVDVSKSIAIKEVLTYFGLDKSEAIAFGDGGNDLDMLELVGLGIAMGNANESLKKAADFVTKKSSEGGIEFALRKFGII